MRSCPGYVDGAGQRQRCGRLTSVGSYCEAHRRTTAQRGYGSAWQRTSRAAIAAHRAIRGDWCPGYGVPPHPSTDLTTDHLVDGDASVLVVGCRACNSRKRQLRGQPGAWGGGSRT